MFSVGRFFMRNNLKLRSYEMRAIYRSFGAKVKDPEGSDVDKSKKSTKGGTTTSDNERKTATQQTVKVAAGKQEVPSPNTTPQNQPKPQEQPQKKNVDTSNRGFEVSGVKRIETVPNHRVNIK